MTSKLFQISQEVELGLVPTCITLSRSGKILLAAFENGTVRTIKQPLSYKTEWNDYHFHSGSVNGVSLSAQLFFLVMKNYTILVDVYF